MRYLSLFWLLIFCLGCKKEKVNETSSVELRIRRPVRNEVIHPHDTLSILVEADAPSELHGYEIKISRKSDGLLVKGINEHIHEAHFSREYLWIPADTLLGQFVLDVSIFIDHEGSTVKDSLSFFIQP